jgi:ATP-dependent phosphoenolpyruvate carboxykinase
VTAIEQSAARHHGCRGRRRSNVGLDALGISAPTNVYWNLTTPEFYELIKWRGEGVYSAHGALMVDTGEHTGRAARDKAIVREPSSEEKVFWGEVNKEFPQGAFDRLRDRMMRHASTRELFVQDTYAGADPRYRLPVRIVTELAWHSLFARTMFINDDAGRERHMPEFTIINLPNFKADPERHLIGDDEYGWSEDGVFNFEGGCYAKVIKLSAEVELPRNFMRLLVLGQRLILRALPTLARRRRVSSPFSITYCSRISLGCSENPQIGWAIIEPV